MDPTVDVSVVRGIDGAELTVSAHRNATGTRYTRFSFAYVAAPGAPTVEGEAAGYALASVEDAGNRDAGDRYLVTLTEPTAEVPPIEVIRSPRQDARSAPGSRRPPR